MLGVITTHLDNKQARNNTYNATRLGIIILLMAVNAILAFSEMGERRFPMGVGPMLCLTPCLLRELDLRNGVPARKLGTLEWSYVLAGVLWVFVVYPLYIF